MASKANVGFPSIQHFAAVAKHAKQTLWFGSRRAASSAGPSSAPGGANGGSGHDLSTGSRRRARNRVWSHGAEAARNGLRLAGFDFYKTANRTFRSVQDCQPHLCRLTLRDADRPFPRRVRLVLRARVSPKAGNGRKRALVPPQWRRKVTRAGAVCPHDMTVVQTLFPAACMTAIVISSNLAGPEPAASRDRHVSALAA